MSGILALQLRLQASDDRSLPFLGGMERTFSEWLFETNIISNLSKYNLNMAEAEFFEKPMRRNIFNLIKIQDLVFFVKKSKETKFESKRLVVMRLHENQYKLKSC